MAHQDMQTGFGGGGAIPHLSLLRAPASVYLAAIAVNLLGLALPLALLQVYDRIIPNGAQATLAALVGCLVLVAVLEAVLRIARLYVDGFNAAKFAHTTTVDAFTRIMDHQNDFFAREPAQKAIDRLDSVARLGAFMGGPGRQIGVDLPFSAVFFIAIALVGGWLVLAPVAIVAVFGLATFAYGSALADSVERKDAQDGRNFDFISEVLRGVSTIKGMASEQFMLRRYERLERSSAGIQYDLIAAADRAQIMAGSLGGVTTIVVVTIGAMMAADGAATVGTVAACSLLAGRAVQPALRVAGFWNEYQRTRLTLSEAARLFASPGARARATTEALDRAPDIRFNAATCALGPDRPCLKDLTFQIDRGDIVSFSGADGSGKSTLACLIAGIVPPDGGEVLVDGTPARQFRDAYVNSVGHVCSDSAVFRGSILDNLTLFGAGCDQGQALRMAHLFGLEDEVFRFPSGYATELGANAVESLPRDFIQRLLIARAVAQAPRLLILDDALSLLEPASDQLVREALCDLRGETTILLMTNSRAHFRISDKVFTVSDGGVALRRTPRARR